MKEQDQPITEGPVELTLFDNQSLDALLPPEEGTPVEESQDVVPAAEVASAPAPAAEAAPSAAVAGTAPKKKKKKKKKKPAEDPTKPKSFFDQIRDFVDEDEDQPININVRGLLGGDGLPGFFRRNWMFIGIIVVCTCCYVTCRYLMQSAVLEHDKLTDQLVDRRYKNLTLDCKLLEHTLSSRVEMSLKDSTLHVPTEQSFVLKTEE